MNKDVPKLMSTGVPITLDKAIKEVRRNIARIQTVITEKAAQ